LLVRGLVRQRELAIRAALGCSKVQLVRLLIAECLLLALAGGVAGLMLSQWGLDALLAVMPAGLPRAHDIQFNGTVLAFTLAVSLAAGLAPALAPVWLYSRTDLRDAINTAGRGNTGGAGQMRLRHVLASIQIALALALLTCTGLFLRSFWALSAQRPGADPSHTLTARLTLPETGYRDPAALIRFQETLETRLAAIPGVQHVGITSLLPLSTGLATAEFSVQGKPVANLAALPSANYRLISPGYFEAMGLALREGRFYSERDDSDHPLVAIVGTALANTFFPDNHAVGQRIQINDTLTGMRTFEIVGVVADVKQQKLEDAPSFDVYVPFRQMDVAAVPWLRFRSYWVLRASVPPQTLEAAIRREVKAIDPDVPVASVRTLDQVADSALAVRRFTLIVISLLAGTALLLTIAGIYAVIAYGVAQRTREIGVRVALGASSQQIVRLVVGEVLGITSTGAVLGLVAIFVLARLMASQLYGVSPHDPAALIASIALLFVIAFVACWLPARRAAQVDPLVAMRAD
jgi:putative ABC transport system permease protein